ncbi:MAG: hypothetical protein JWM11_2824 [Planctomycetaceae bacterium]|nr:hypothetical protein [Planctomycetaceae bacterium]
MFKLELLSVFCVLIVASGCLVNSEDDEHLNLSYSDFRAAFPREIDPVGASAISMGGEMGRDSYDSWYKVVIPETAWNEFCKQNYSEDPKPFKPDGLGGLGVPSSWPEPRRSPPKWWLPPEEFGSQLLVTQQIMKDGRRAKGWYWLYDKSTSTAIGWNWNRQYWSFQQGKAAPNLRASFESIGTTTREDAPVREKSVP